MSHIIQTYRTYIPILLLILLLVITLIQILSANIHASAKKKRSPACWPSPSHGLGPLPFFLCLGAWGGPSLPSMGVVEGGPHPVVGVGWDENT